MRLSRLFDKVMFVVLIGLLVWSVYYSFCPSSSYGQDKRLRAACHHRGGVWTDNTCIQNIPVD